MRILLQSIVQSTALIFLSFFFSSKLTAQCADNAQITNNTKCVILTWNVAPGSIPTTITIGVETYTQSSATMTTAEYERVVGNGCNAYGAYSGDITMDGFLCTYGPTGDLTGSQSLPVNMLRFNVDTEDGQGKLTWATASELNNTGFEIQKLKNSTDWERIGWVDGNGTTNELNAYRFTDRELNEGINYYRLKQIDFDGTYNFSKIVSASHDRIDQFDFVISPNPTNQLVTFKFNNTDILKTLTIYNQIGLPVASVNLFDLMIDVSEYPAGIYLVVAELGQQVVVDRLVVLH